jgi:hypothetical protein
VGLPNLAPRSQSADVPPLSRVIRISLLACLFAIVVGARWGVLNRFGTDLPQWDQWDAEGLHLLAPWFQHRFTLGELFLAHNEHRVVLTKLVNLGLTLANGQWDQRLEAVVNAFLPALIATALFSMAARHVVGKWHAPLFLVIASAFSLPLAWENLINGFHSQQFFLIGLSFGTIACLCEASPWSRKWWLGAICAILALGSMATGFFAPAVVIVVLSWRVQKREIPAPTTTATLFFCAAITAVGWFTHATVIYHDSLKAQNAEDFLLSVLHSLQWPTPSTSWAFVPLWLPWGWLAYRTVIRRQENARKTFDWILVALGGWVLLQVLATAYARGAGGDPPASRYVDTLAFGAVVNAIAVAWLAAGVKAHGETAGRVGRTVSQFGVAAAWVGVFVGGVYFQTRHIFGVDLPPLRTFEAACEQNVRDYLATGDESYLQAGAIPYPVLSVFLERIRIPELRALLPVSVRPPLPLTLGAEQTSFISHDSRPPSRADQFAAAVSNAPTGFPGALPPLSNRTTWGSFGGGGAADTGTWTSAPLSASRGWLMFQTAGQIGEPGVTLELHDPSTGALLAAVRPTQIPENSWRAAYVRTPREPFVIAASDEDSQRWLAFAEPVEMGPLSHWAWRAAKQGWLIAEIAAGAALLLGLAQPLVSRRQST